MKRQYIIICLIVAVSSGLNGYSYINYNKMIEANKINEQFHNYF